MKKLAGIAAVLLAVGLTLYTVQRPRQATPPPVPVTDADAQTHALTAYGRFPMRFEANQGQTDKHVDFLARGPGYTLFLTPAEAVLALRKGDPTQDTTPTEAVVRMRLVGAHPTPAVQGEKTLPTRTNYLLGNDPAQWHTHVPNYNRVRYADVYPGIDVAYYGNPQQLEYDFIVAPGTDPDAITLDFDGAERMTLDEAGNLVLQVDGGEVVQHAPVSYQEIDGERRPVASRYVRKGAQQVGFEIGAYDPTTTLIIDPEITYATYLAGGGDDAPKGLAVDAAGNRYLVGITSSTDFPTVNPIQGTPGASQDVFVAKLNAEGTALLYATYLGGDEFEFAAGIGLDAAGNAYIAGETRSENFPVKNAVQPGRSAGSTPFTFDAFAAALNADGSDLIYSTYLGGSNNETAVGMGVDAAGNTYVTGTTASNDFRVASAYQNTLNGQQADSYVAKFTPTGGLAYATYLGGRSRDEARGLGVDDAGNAYVVGQSSSVDFPLRQDIAPFTASGGADGFVAKLNTNGQPEFASFFGFFGTQVAPNDAGQIYVWGGNGRTQPTAPVNAFQPTPGDATGLDGFLVKLNATADAILYASYLGGSDEEQPNALVVDADDNAYVYGTTRSSDFPVKEAVQPDFGGDQDMFLAKVNAAGGLEYATYLGGPRYDDNAPNSLAVDANGTVHFAFQTDSGSLPTAPNAFQSSGRGAVSTYVAALTEGGKNILVQDFRLNPVANTTLEVFEVHSLSPYAQTRRGEITTDADGKAMLPRAWFDKGDRIKLQRLVHTEPAVRANREVVDNTAYLVMLDNASVDPDGKVSYPECEDVPEQSFLLAHTTVLFNLVVSIEWDAEPEYINSVIEGFRHASNFLYDVSNAQLYFNKIAVFDDKQRWSSADVRIFASNQEWPGAHVFGWKLNAVTRTIQTIGMFMPREFAGTKDRNRNIDVSREPRWTDPTTYRTLAHEFGHYGLGFRDEYQDEDREKVFTDINLGFMDNQYPNGGPLSSEMSSDLQYRSEDRHVTAQWAEHGMSCWDLFTKTFEVRENGTLVAPLFPPFEGIKVGPNDTFLDADVGSLMERVVANENGGAVSTLTGFSHPALQQNEGITVWLEKADSGRQINQGKTDNQGRLRLLGTHAGDEVRAYVKRVFFSISDNDVGYESLIAQLTLSAVGKTGQDTLLIEMRRIEGDLAWTNTLDFLDANRLRYQVHFNTAPAQTPEFEAYPAEAATRSPFTDEGSERFSIEATLPDDGEGLWTVWSVDATNAEFFIDQPMAVLDLTGSADTDQIASADGGMEAGVDSLNGVERVAVLTGEFPPLRNGLSDDAEQAGDVHTLALFPSVATLQGSNNILIRYQDTDLARGREASIRIFRWDPNAATWQLVGGSVDTEVNEVIAQITHAGTYAAFTTESNDPGTAPSFGGVTPGSATQGDTGVTLTIQGQNFRNGTTVAFSGSGITTTAVSRLSATQLQATIDVAATASPGLRTITVTNPDGQSITVPNAFEVLERSALIAVLSWNPPPAGQTLVPPENLTVNLGGTTAPKAPAVSRRIRLDGNLTRTPAVAKHLEQHPYTPAADSTDEVEPNNTVEEAQGLAGTAPLAVKGNAEIDDEGGLVLVFGEGENADEDDLEDLYRITTIAPGLFLTLDGITSDCDLYLLNEAGTEIVESSTFIGATEPEEIDVPELPAGTYLIGVSIYDLEPEGAPTTPYVLTVEGSFEDTGQDPTLLSYNIYRSLSPDAITTGTQIGSADATTTTYADVLPGNGMYYYQVTAVYDQGESAPSGEATLSVAVAVEEIDTVPVAFVLRQNYPNPFNPVTTIPFDVQEPGRVVLKVFDLLGRHVQTVVDAHHGPGRYQVRFEARGLPSGVYIYQLEASSYRDRKTMLLLK